MFAMYGAMFALSHGKSVNISAEILQNNSFRCCAYCIPWAIHLFGQWATWTVDRKVFDISYFVCEPRSLHPNLNQSPDNSIYCRIWSNNLIKRPRLNEWVLKFPAALKAKDNWFVFNSKKLWGGSGRRYRIHLLFHILPSHQYLWSGWKLNFLQSRKQYRINQFGIHWAFKVQHCSTYLVLR